MVAYFRFKLLRYLIILILSGAFFACPAEAYSNIEIDKLSQQIIDDEIEMDKLITKTHLENRISDASDLRRQCLWPALNAAATESGLIDATQLFFSHSRYRRQVQLNGTVKKISRPVSGGANAAQLYPQIIGQEVCAGGDAFEIGVDLFHRMKAIKHNLDPENSLRRIKQIIIRIDEHLDRFSTLAKNFENEDQRLLYAEYKVLQDVRDALLSEYARVYVQARKDFAWQNSMNTLDLMRNVIGAIGNQINVQAGYTGNNHLNGLGCILSEVAAAGITTQPVFSLMSAKTNEILARRKVKRFLPTANKEWRSSVHSDLVALKNTASAPTFASRDIQLDKEIFETQLMDSQQALAEREGLFFDQTLKWQIYRNCLYGPTKITVETIGIINGYDSHLNATRKNQLSAAGNLTYTIGQGYNLIQLGKRFAELEKKYNREKERTKQQHKFCKRALALWIN